MGSCVSGSPAGSSVHDVFFMFIPPAWAAKQTLNLSKMSLIIRRSAGFCQVSSRLGNCNRADWWMEEQTLICSEWKDTRRDGNADKWTAWLMKLSRFCSDNSSCTIKKTLPTSGNSICQAACAHSARWVSKWTPLSAEILSVDSTAWDAVELLGLINQSSSFEIAVGQALSIKNESCCTCQRDVRFIFLLAAADWGASNFNEFN